VKVGDLVRNNNSESGELGLFIGLRTFTRIYEVSSKIEDRGSYDCAEVYWPKRNKIGTIQTNLISLESDTCKSQQAMV
jgi:hypothetical protein